jgi:hypothetical protein
VVGALKASVCGPDTRLVAVMNEDRDAGSRDPVGAPDPDDPATWIRPVACDGHDRHPLSIPWQRAAGSGVAGAGLIAVDTHWHVYGRSLGVGIGLLLVPLLTLLFARWSMGPSCATAHGGGCVALSSPASPRSASASRPPTADR